MAAKSSTVILPFVLMPVRLVDRGPLILALREEDHPLLSHSGRRRHAGDVDPRVATGKAPDPQWTRAWPERIAAAGEALWFYLGKLLFPHPLMTVYPRWQTDAGQWSSYLPLLAAIAILSVLWLRHEAWSRACFFAFALFCGGPAAGNGFARQYNFPDFPGI